VAVDDGVSLRETFGVGVVQVQRRNCEAEKRLVGGLRAGWRRKRPAASPD